MYIEKKTGSKKNYPTFDFDKTIYFSFLLRKVFVISAPYEL